MCLLVVASPNSTPRKKDLECASCNNPHGFGFAVVTPNGIVTGRGMSSKKVIKQFLEVRKEFPDSYAMFHARYATHGVKNEDNCHPFKVPSEHDTYLAHNGILDINISAGDRRSDTRIFAEDTLPAMGGVTALDDDHVWAMVSKWSTGSKIVVFTLDPAAKETCYIVNETAGHWDNEGMWWSNSTYKQSTWSAYLGTPSKASMLALNDGGYTENGNGDYEKYACAHCLTVSYEDANPYYCEMCMTCFDCDGMYSDTCLCWTPESDRYAYNKKGKVSGYYNESFGF